MSESGTRVALVGDDLDLGAAVRAAGGEVVGVDAADVVVTVGEPALIDAALERPTAPILPVAAEDGEYAVARPDAADAVAEAVAGEGSATDHPIVRVAVDGEPVGEALFDVSLFTREPARISEYAVHDGAETLDAVRADGIVVATPLGSDGYARAAGGPVLRPGTGLLVAPVAPFATQSTDWITPDGVTITVERKRDPVALLLDDIQYDDGPVKGTVRIEVADRVSLLRVPTLRR